MKYVDAFEIAKRVREYRSPRFSYREGVERAAALAAAGTKSADEAIAAMTDKFNRYEMSPRWDGSIA